VSVLHRRRRLGAFVLGAFDGEGELLVLVVEHAVLVQVLIISEYV